MQISSANVNGLLSKLAEIEVRLQDLDAFLLQETKLDSSISDSELAFEGFSLFRRDRTRNGGGVAIYCREYLGAQLLHRVPGSEILAVKLSRLSGQVLASCYKPPSESRDDFCSNLSNFLSSLDQSTISRLVLAGDFNLDPYQPEYQPLNQTVNFYSLKQQVSETTHRSRTIDLAFTGPNVTLSSCELSAPIEKEHAVVTLAVAVSPLRPLPLKLQPSQARPCFRNADWAAVRRALAEAGLLESTVTPPTVEEAWALWSAACDKL